MLTTGTLCIREGLEIHSAVYYCEDSLQEYNVTFHEEGVDTSVFPSNHEFDPYYSYPREDQMFPSSWKDMNDMYLGIGIYKDEDGAGLYTEEEAKAEEAAMGRLANYPWYGES